MTNSASTGISGGQYEAADDRAEEIGRTSAQSMALLANDQETRKNMQPVSARGQIRALEVR